MKTKKLDPEEAAQLKEIRRRELAEYKKEQAATDAAILWHDQAVKHKTHTIIQRGTQITLHRHYWMTGPDGKTFPHGTTTSRWDMTVEKERRYIPKFVLRQLQPA